MENNNLYQKLFKVKSKIGKISKDSTNPFFKSKYFDVNALLEHVEPLLQEERLLLLQPVSNGSISSVIYDIDSSKGEDYISSSIALEDIKDPQKLGSAITYYRRYTLQSLLGLQAVDDDANKASGKTTLPAQDNDDKQWLNVGDKAWEKAVSKKLPISEVRKHYKVSKANAEQYEKAIA